MQAWDAADEYLLNHLYENEDLNTLVSANIAIINDEFGALGCALSAINSKVKDANQINQPLANIYTFSDSFMSHQALKQNLAHNLKHNFKHNFKHNHLDAVQAYDVLTLSESSSDKFSEQVSDKKLPDCFDYVLIKIPRTLALLEQELISLSQYISEDTKIIAAAKVKLVSTNVLKLFERYIGPTRTSLAVKKARLVFCCADEKTFKIAVEHPPSLYPTIVTDPALDFDLYNHANVFCREQLDIGARLMLETFRNEIRSKDKSNEKQNRINALDLGCGNGVLGIAYLRENPNATMTFVDESFMAVASARLSFEHAFSEQTQKPGVNFMVSHCLQTLSDELSQHPSQQIAKEMDLILCNPPFHQQNVITTDIAWQMFLDARKHLKKGGELRVVANRHLPYFEKLKRLFGNCSLLANNRKFVVLSCIR